MSPTLFASVVALAILIGAASLLMLGYWLLGAQGQRRLQQRLSATGAAKDEFEAQQERPLLASMARGGKRMETWVDTEGESTRLLLQAGWRSTESRLLWYAFQLVLPLLLAGLVLAFWLFGPEQQRGVFTLMFSFVAATLSFLVPRWLLRGIAGARRRRIKREVPLFIHVLALLFDAGLSTRQAFASIVREGRGVLPELGKELETVLRQLEAGGDTAEVLKTLGDTLGVEDLTTVIAVLRQVDRYGGEIRQPLLEILSVLEERRSLDARERVNLISGRMTVVMVMFFFPALLIFIAGPAFSSILRALREANQ